MARRVGRFYGRLERRPRCQSGGHEGECHKRTKMNPRGRDAFGNILFPGILREQMRLIVDIPKDSRKNNYEIFVRQLHNNEEIGRITWRLVPPVQKN